MAAFIVIDTDVLSVVYTNRRRPDDRRASWSATVVGESIAIATQTYAETISGAYSAGWGSSRLTGLRAQLSRFATVPVTESVVEAYARIKADCVRRGHGLGQKTHDGDRWIAATAVAADLPLLSGDSIFRDVPNLTLVETGD